MPFETFRFKISGNTLRDAAQRKIDSLDSKLKDSRERAKRLLSEHGSAVLMDKPKDGDSEKLAADKKWFNEFSTDAEKKIMQEREELEFFRDNLNIHGQYEMPVPDLAYLELKHRQ